MGSSFLPASVGGAGAEAGVEEEVGADLSSLILAEASPLFREVGSERALEEGGRGRKGNADRLRRLSRRRESAGTRFVFQ